MILAVLASLHLVYHYRMGSAPAARGSFGPTNASFDKSAGNAGGNAAMSSMAFDGNAREGTISVSLVQQGNDGAAVYSVSEDGRKAFLCAVSGVAGDAICDVDAHFGDQTLILLRLLTPTFYDPARLDRDAHWSAASSQNGFSETSDFTITNNGASLKTIRMVRKALQRNPDIATDIDGTLEYDPQKHAVASLHCQMTKTAQDPGAPPPVTVSLDVNLTGG